MMTGAHVQPCIGGQLFPPRSASLSAYARVVPPHYWDTARIPGEGALQTHFPVSAAPRQVTGSLRRGYVDDFYGWVHVGPRRFDIGVITEDRYFDVYVWNACLQIKSVDKIYTLPSGVFLLGHDLPVRFNRFEEKKWKLLVSITGDPIVDTPEFYFRRQFCGHFCITGPIRCGKGLNGQQTF